MILRESYLLGSIGKVDKLLLRVQFRRFLRFLMNSLMSELDESELGASAVVFSPHPDDETLGCGGTVIKKKRVHANVKIVFMTEGGRSTHQLISEDKLKSIRAGEGLAAGNVLGVDQDDITFLGFESGKLGEKCQSAVSKVVEILMNQRPEEIFVPYCMDSVFWSEDHSDTNRIVLSALRICRRRAVVYEYPVGFWYHWPWTSRERAPTAHPLLAWLIALWRSIASDLSMLRDFRCFVRIMDVLEIKRVALNQHKSQMTRLVPDKRWQTLADVSNGEFLDCFFQEREIFRCYSPTLERSA